MITPRQPDLWDIIFQEAKEEWPGVFWVDIKVPIIANNKMDAVFYRGKTVAEAQSNRVINEYPGLRTMPTYYRLIVTGKLSLMEGRLAEIVYDDDAMKYIRNDNDVKQIAAEKAHMVFYDRPQFKFIFQDESFIPLTGKNYAEALKFFKERIAYIGGVKEIDV